MAVIRGTCPRCHRRNVALDKGICGPCHAPFSREVAKKVEDLRVRGLPRAMRHSARRDYRRRQNTGGDGCAVVVLAAAALPGFLAAAWFLFG